MFSKLENSLAALFKITKKRMVPMPRQPFPSIKQNRNYNAREMNQ